MGRLTQKLDGRRRVSLRTFSFASIAFGLPSSI